MATTNYSAVSVGIDVSKDKLDAALLLADQTYLQRTFDNSNQGIKSLILYLNKQRTAKTAPCVVESTGDYHLRSAIMITQGGWQVKCINPIITKKYQKSSIRNAKSDSIDAKRLAQIGFMESDLPLFSANIDAISIKKLISYLSQLEKTKQQLKASLKHLESAQELLSLNIDLNSSKQALKAIDEQINLLKAIICDKTPRRAKQLSEETKGLSETQVAVLLGLLTDKHFTHRDQLAAFAGFDIAVRKSGKWQGREKISKRGNPYLRKILYQIAWGLKQNNEYYQNYYNRLYREQGKHYTTTLIAIARKFLRHLYAYYWQGNSYSHIAA